MNINKSITDPEVNTVEENVAAGVVGAFLFALIGGALWFVLYLFGFIASLSGFVGIICAIKGYSLFAKKESVKGVVIAIVMTVLVLVVAWYFCLSYDVYMAYQNWFAEGEIDFTLTFVESVRSAYLFLGDSEIALPYLADLGIGLLFCALGAFSSVKAAVKRIKAPKATEGVPTEDIVVNEIDFSQPVITQNAEDAQNAESVENIESHENIECGENTENIESHEDIAGCANAESSQKSESTGNGENTESGENITVEEANALKRG